MDGCIIPYSQVRPFNLENSTNLRDLNPEDIDKMISVKGFVVRASQPIPELKEGRPMNRFQLDCKKNV